MKAMTYSEFEEIANQEFARLDAEAPGKWRIGQVYFNKLKDVRPEVAEQLRGSMIDPFNKHRITEVVRHFVSEHWDKK